MKEKRNKIGIEWKKLAALQIVVFIYSVLSMCSKLLSVMIRDHGLFSLQTIGAGCLFMGSMALYAFLWQQILRFVDLQVAYANKAVGLLWSLVWSVVLFHEKLTLRSGAGLLVVIAGVLLVSDRREEP